MKQLQYSLAGAQTSDPQVVLGRTASTDVTAEGITTVTYSATDESENAEATETVTVRIDQTAPVNFGMATGGCTLWPVDQRLKPVATIRVADAVRHRRRCLASERDEQLAVESRRRCCGHP